MPTSTWFAIGIIVRVCRLNYLACKSTVSASAVLMSFAFSMPMCLTWITFLTAAMTSEFILPKAVACMNWSIVISGMVLVITSFAISLSACFRDVLSFFWVSAMILIRNRYPSFVLTSPMKLISDDPRLTRLLRNSFAYSYRLKIEVAVSPSTLLIWKYSLNWCWEGSPFTMSNNVTSTTLPMALSSSVIGM